jgi:hypothetical protein
VSTVSFEAPIGTDRPSALLPQWAVRIVRILLAAQAVIAATVGALAAILHVLTRVCYPGSFCEFGDIFMAAAVLPTIVFAGLAILGARLLRRERLHGLIAFGLAAISIGGCAFTLAAMRLSLALEGSQYSAVSYQFWAAWPLVVWPAVGVVVTLLLGLVSGRAAPRRIGIGWPATCVVVSAFLLTYLLPATDEHVAGLHGMGVVRLPQSMGTIQDSGGHRLIVRDRDPIVFVNLGNGGYIVTIFPGDYTVTEDCFDPNQSKYSSATAKIRVDLGRTTVATDGCKSG